VLAPTLPSHAGGPRVTGDVGVSRAADAIERLMDDAGFATADVVGNSLGGFLALELAARGRAGSVVALAPAGGWSMDDPMFDEQIVAHFTAMQELARAAAPHVDSIVATPEGRRRATELITTNYEHIPSELIAHQIVGVAACDDVGPMLEIALRDGWNLDAARIDCPVRIVWGTRDIVLPWPAAAARFCEEWLPRADYILLEDAGHCPQLDVPVETAALI
jgi:pimeloyl-ACP methyl ester carboxylesterase